MALLEGYSEVLNKSVRKKLCGDYRNTSNTILLISRIRRDQIRLSVSVFYLRPCKERVPKFSRGWEASVWPRPSGTGLASPDYVRPPVT